MSETLTKQEIQSRIMEVQKEYSDLSARLKEIQAEEKRSRARSMFGEYKLKVSWYGDIHEEAKIMESTDEDFKIAEFDEIGQPMAVYPGGMGTFDAYVLIKSEEDLPRLKDVYRRLNAARTLLSGKKDKLPSKNRDKMVAQLMGEVYDEKEST